MKVLVDATTLDGRPSGAATRLLALGRELDGRPDLEISYLVRPGVDPLPGLGTRPFAGTTTPAGRLLAGRRVGRLLAECGADLLAWGALPLPRPLPRPVVLTVHDLRLLDDPAGQGWLRRLWTATRLRADLRDAGGIVAVSETTARGLAERGLVAAERVSVVPNAGTPGLERVDDPDAMAAFRRQAELNSRYVLALGPIAPHKRPGHLLAALAAARAQPGCADLALVLAGRADPGRALTVARRAESLGLAGALRIVGELSDAQLATALSGADALVSAGRIEGFGLPVVDAQRLGVPVVGVAAGALPEVAADGAWLADPDDPEALGRALAAAVTPCAERDARLARGRELAARWSWRRSADALEVVWRSLAGNAAAAV